MADIKQHGRSKAEGAALLDSRGRKRLISGHSCSECGHTMPVTTFETAPSHHAPACGRKHDKIDRV